LDNICNRSDILVFAPIEVTTHFSGLVDWTIFGMIIKDICANLVVKTSMENTISILVQLKTIVVHATIIPNHFATMKDLRVNVRVEETKATSM
jgi:hypothetical protein